MDRIHILYGVILTKIPLAPESLNIVRNVSTIIYDTYDSQQGYQFKDSGASELKLLYDIIHYSEVCVICKLNNSQNCECKLGIFSIC